MTAQIAVGLSAVIVAADARAPSVLVTHHDGQLIGLPHGRFDPDEDRTFELGLRNWVREQTGFEPGYVEQLYTFGDRGRELPQADLGDAPHDARLISVGYLGLTPEKVDVTSFEAVWRSWYAFFPWEDHRLGRPDLIDGQIAPALRRWADASGSVSAQRLDRVRVAFGLDERRWIEERTLERYELMYEAGLAPEAARDLGREAPEVATSSFGEPMISDHRRILATAIGRLRGKIKYRPVVFELMPERFTLLQLQKAVEAILGLALHKQNFRRAVDRSGWLRGSAVSHKPPADALRNISRFRREALRDGTLTGVQTPRA